MLRPDNTISDRQFSHNLDKIVEVYPKQRTEAR